MRPTSSRPDGVFGGVIVFFLFTTLTGCTLAPVYTGNRTVTLRVATPLGASAGGRGVLGANLETLRVEVTGAGFAKVDTVIAPTSPGVYDAKVTVPVGKGRTFTVTARDAAGKGYATGTTVADLTQPTATVAVTLAPVTVGAPVVTTPGYTADFTGLAMGEVSRVVFEPVVATTQGFQATLVDAALAVVNVAGSVVARGTTGWTMGSGGSVVLLYTKTGAAPALAVAMTGPVNPVMYDAGGAETGNAPVDATPYAPGDTVTVQGNPGGMSKAGYTFAGWVSALDGSGTSYPEASTFTKPAGNVTLHAVWVPDYLTFTTYGNDIVVTGHTGSVPASAVVPEGVTQLSGAFTGATSLISVVLPQSLTILGAGAFNGCASLTSVTVPPLVKTVGNLAFQSCTSLNNVFLPFGLTTLGIGAFRDCQALKTLSLPSTVTSINDFTFSRSGLTSIDIPPGVKSLVNNAFFDCPSLVSVTGGAGLTSVGFSVFENCQALTSLSLPNVNTLGSSVLANCTNLATLSIPKVTSLDSTMLAGDTELVTADVSGATTIGDSAFLGLSKVANVSLAPGLTALGASAFSGCSSLANITLPPGLTSLGASAFSNCSSLSSITLPPGITSLGDSTFSGSGLTGIAFPPGFTSIGQNAFQRCHFTSVVLPSTLTFLGVGAFTGCSDLVSADLSMASGITTIQNASFLGCKKLALVNLPPGLKTVGFMAFKDTALTSMVLPLTVTDIDIAAFAPTPLTSVTIESASAPTIGVYPPAFPLTNPGFSISIPSATLTDYQTKYVAWPELLACLVPY